MAPPHAASEVGFWGEPTATIDWCEGNYQVTQYIAEFWNTISNLIMIVPPFIGIYQALRLNLEQRYIWLHLSVFFVGIGSWFFHMTLRYGMQIADELPMVFGSCFYIYTLFEVCQPPKTNANLPLAAFLSFYSVVATVVYLIVKEPLLFHVIYGVTVVVTVLKALYNIKYLYPCKQVSSLYFSSLFSYCLGFMLWNIDIKFCSGLTNVRNSLPLLVAPISQFHAWWHILAAIATYQSIVFNCLSRQIYLGRSCSMQVSLGIFPYLTFENKQTL